MPKTLAILPKKKEQPATFFGKEGGIFCFFKKKKEKEFNIAN